MLQDLSNLSELYNVIEGSWYDLFQRLSSTPLGHSYEDQHLRRLYTTIPSDLFNGVYLATLPADLVDQNIDETKAFFTQRNCPFRWFIGPLTKPRSARALRSTAAITSSVSLCAFFSFPFVLS
jgi:hypothetical protein